MKLNVKKLLPDAIIPTYATDGSNGLDFTASGVVIMPDYLEVRTGISIEVPKGYVGLLFPRSSISARNLMLANSVGVIDSDYRGEVIFRFKVLEDRAAGVNKYSKIYKQGDRIGQLVLMEVPKVEVVEVKELEETERGNGGFGSTDN